ncbi:MAG TPA: PAS domain S-box protein, partial [Gallionella sp.]|nr:PAS domain S-box protein [Gallionella sp.]
RMLGYTQEEVTSLNVADCDAQWSPEELQARFKDFIGKNGVFETLHRCKDGTLLDVEISTSHVEMEGQDFFFALSRDITERKQAEAVLRQHKLVLDTSIDGFWMTDVRGNLLEANEAYAKMSGYPVDELVNMHISQLSVQDQSPEKVQARIEKLMVQGNGRFESRHRHKDGHEIDVEVSVTYMAEPQRLFAFCRDITERKRAEQALHEANRHKDEFLAMLAHELRNPLAPIRNAAHVIGRLGLAEPKVKWAQEVIERQVTHLTRMVDDLLDVSRIARGKITLKQEVIELAALVEQVMQSARPLAEGKGHQLAVRPPDQAVQIEGDPVRLFQLLFNLLDNAIKYTQDGGQIEFAVCLAGQEVEISVRDNGTGITAELLPRVFDLFQQDERKLDRAQGGLGIGLTLVQYLAWMHGGRVKADSAGPGLGSTFTIWLPAKVKPASLSKSEAENRSHLATGMRVLVVEDDHAVADSTAVLLEMEGHQACIAESGQAALKQIPEFRPQVVLLDIGLKGMDGFETAQRLRQLPQGSELCLVAVTGYADSATREQALASGCDHFLVKPVTFQALSGLLDKVAVPTASI